MSDNWDPFGTSNNQGRTQQQSNYSSDLSSVLTPQTTYNPYSSPTNSSTSSPVSSESIDELELNNYRIACETMENAFGKLEKGGFDSALQDIEQTIRTLGLISLPSLNVFISSLISSFT